MEIKTLGQVFTPEFIVDEMINLISIKEPSLILEPSSGSGNFYYKLIEKYKNVVGVEIDESVAHKNAVIKSYFETDYHPDVIVGNPPYVDFKNIINKPNKTSLFQKPNLYLYFLEKALFDLKEDGELIWIIPASIFTTSSSKVLNKIIYENYSITFFKPTPENVWENARVATVIIKIIKTKNHKEKLNYFFSNGKILFGIKPTFNTPIIIKVSGASGLKEMEILLLLFPRLKEIKNLRRFYMNQRSELDQFQFPQKFSHIKSLLIAKQETKHLFIY